MLLTASLTPKYNSIVQDIQNKLNAIRCRVHGNWSYLQPDGLFGEKTKQAVKAFQSYRNITPISGDIGDTTLYYINEAYSHVPQIRKADSNIHQPYQSNQIDWKVIAGDFVTRFANVLNDTSKDIESQIKSFKSQKVTSQDVERLMRIFFNRPDVDAMRDKIEANVFTELKKTARGNTNVMHTSINSHSISTQRTIREAQRQVSKGVLNAQNRKAVEKNLAEQLLNKVVEELEGANFKNKITKAIRGKGIPKITGSGILTTVMLLPIGWHFCVWVDAYINGKPNVSNAFNTFIADIISLIEGVLIGLAVGAVIAAIGLVGWVAVVVALVVSIIIGVILEIFFPSHSEWLAEKIITSTKNLINSSVFQETARNSFI